MSGLIWIQSVWQSYVIPERIFEKVDFEKKNTDGNKNHENFAACKELKLYKLKEL